MLSQIIYYIQWIAIAQVILVILLVLISYIYKGYFNLKQKHIKKQEDRLDKLISDLISHPKQLTGNNVSYFKKYLPILLLKMKKYKQNLESPNCHELRTQLINKVLKPQGRILAFSKKWFKRFTSANCFHYGLDTTDVPDLIHLIQDKTLLISLNAAQVALKYPTPNLINTVIDTFAKGRHLQQTTFSNILALAISPITVAAIFKRLENDPDPYIRTFCYRLLTFLPKYQKLNPTIEDDLKSQNVDLKIATLKYLAYYRDNSTVDLIRQQLQDENWEVRAVVAKLLGEMKDKIAIPRLSELLTDSAWWVRVNVAEALAKFGKEGIAILKAQNNDTDRYAYEAARQVLLTYQEEGSNLD